MSTKLRSACDRCHEAKVRCNGEVPCQGCLTSRNLCFYSVSNPLGRPRGTKKKQMRTDSSGNNISDRDGATNGDATATVAGTMGDRGLRKRTRTSRGVNEHLDNADDGNDSMPWDPVESNVRREDSSDLLGSNCPSSRENLSYHEHSDIGISEGTAPNAFGINSLDPADSGFHSDALPNNFDYDDLDNYEISDVARSDFGSIANAGTGIPTIWDNALYNNESETSSNLIRTRVQNPASKGYSRTQGSPFGDFPQTSNSQSKFQAIAGSNLDIRVPTSSENVAGTSPLMNPTKTSSLLSSSSNTCTCLQKHAEVLGNPILSETRPCDGPDDGVWSMAKALSLAKQARKAWHSLLSCPICPYNDDQEVMLLTFMSIRAITRYLQRLSPRFTNTARTSLQGSSIKTQRSAEDDSRLRIGSFELEGGEQMLVLKVLYQDTLQKVKRVLYSLQMIQEEKKKRLLEETQSKTAGVHDYQASSNLFHIQQMSYGLFSSIQKLESSLNGKQQDGCI